MLVQLYQAAVLDSIVPLILLYTIDVDEFYVMFAFLTRQNRYIGVVQIGRIPTGTFVRTLCQAGKGKLMVWVVCLYLQLL